MIIVSSWYAKVVRWIILPFPLIPSWAECSKFTIEQLFIRTISRKQRCAADAKPLMFFSLEPILDIKANYIATYSKHIANYENIMCIYIYIHVDIYIYICVICIYLYVNMNIYRKMPNIHIYIYICAKHTYIKMYGEYIYIYIPIHIYVVYIYTR